MDFVSESYGGPKKIKASRGAKGKAAQSNKTETINLWDIVQKETTAFVAAQRIRRALVDMELE